MNDTYSPTFDAPSYNVCGCCGAYAPSGACDDCDRYECTGSGCKVPRRNIVSYVGKPLVSVVTHR